MLRCAKTYDTELTPEKSLSLQVKADEVFMLATLTIITTGLSWNVLCPSEGDQEIVKLERQGTSYKVY